MRAAVYVRISDDEAGQGLGVARQEADCRSLAATLGAKSVRVFSDNDVSASTLSKKMRPEYLAMLNAVRAGEIDVLLAYSNSRLTRRPRELEDLIDLHRDTQVLIRTVVSGDDDLATADGRMVARIKANVDAAEAERTGERVKRQKQQRLAEGMPLGSRYRTFGYTRDWQEHPSEASIVRDVFDRFASGESINSISQDLASQGVQTVSGKPWRFAATHRLLANANYAGLLAYKGEVIGKAKIPALVSEAMYQAAQQDRTKRIGQNTRKFLLTGILICDLCKAPMSGLAARSNAGARYRCNVLGGGCGKVSILASTMDDIVNNYMSSIVMFPAWAGETKKKVAPDDTRLADKDTEIEAIQLSDLDLADKVALLKRARSERQVILKEQTSTVLEQDNFWQALVDYDSADLSVKRVIIRRTIQHIFVMPYKGRLPKDEAHRRFYVLTAPTHPSPNDLVMGGAIYTYDQRPKMTDPQWQSGRQAAPEPI